MLLIRNIFSKRSEWCSKYVLISSMANNLSRQHPSQLFNSVSGLGDRTWVCHDKRAQEEVSIFLPFRTAESSIKTSVKSVFRKAQRPSLPTFQLVTEELQKGKVSFSFLLLLAGFGYLESLMDSMPSSSLFLFIHTLRMTPISQKFIGFLFLFACI